MKPLFTIIVWALTAYVLYCTVLFFAQRRLMFPRHLLPVPAPAVSTQGVETLRVPSGGGYVDAWFLGPGRTSAGGRAPAVIVAHGNAEVIDYLPGEFEWIRELGIGVMLVEFPGYGRSQGSPSQESITGAFISAYDMLVERPDVDSSRILLFGRSVGSGAACALAEKRPSAAMVLVSPFTSTRVFANAYFAPGFLVRDPFDNLSTVQGYPNPVLVFHGEYDEIIPFSHGRALAGAAPMGNLIGYPCGHNDFPPDQGRFRRDLSNFLFEAGILSQSPKQPGD
jgi:pimeloyl-ACP methyl ester carboxylesterase